MIDTLKPFNEMVKLGVNKTDILPLLSFVNITRVTHGSRQSQQNRHFTRNIVNIKRITYGQRNPLLGHSVRDGNRREISLL